MVCAHECMYVCTCSCVCLCLGNLPKAELFTGRIPNVSTLFLQRVRLLRETIDMDVVEFVLQDTASQFSFELMVLHAYVKLIQ
jgi:hypothetical protein